MFPTAATDPGFHQLQARKWFGLGVGYNHTPRDIATTREPHNIFGSWSPGIRFLSSIHYPWNTRFRLSGRNSREIYRKGKGMGEESPSSHFRLRPDVQSQARRKDRKGEPQFFSLGEQR